jgi:3-hydroxyacyl-[acyl-carrier-protein] dehydratase
MVKLPNGQIQTGLSCGVHFSLVDAVLERSSDRIVTIKHVSSAEEYLQDHFPGYPVLPGVMMLEAMVQAARLLADPEDVANPPLVLGGVRGLKYGRFVPPGATLRVEVTRFKVTEAGEEFKAEALLVEPTAAAGIEHPVAASGRITLRPARA